MTNPQEKLDTEHEWICCFAWSKCMFCGQSTQYDQQPTLECPYKVQMNKLRELRKEYYG